MENTFEDMRGREGIKLGMTMSYDVTQTLIYYTYILIDDQTNRIKKNMIR